MPSAFSDWASCLYCFSRRRKLQPVHGVSPWTPPDLEAKVPNASSLSVDSTDQRISGTTSSSLVEEKADEKIAKLLPTPDLIASAAEKAGLEKSLTQQNPANLALLVTAKGHYTLTDNFDFPALQNQRDVIMQSVVVGLNPIDWKSVDYGFCLPSFPWITGREMAGVVHEVGSEVTGVKVGDLVWTSTYYRDRRAGCFQHFVTVPEHTVLPLPQNLSMEQAATLGVAGLTAAMTLWHWLHVPIPSSSSTIASTTPPQGNDYLLLWGGATTTGQYLTQLAALAHIKTIVVASAKTETLCRSLGATQVVVRDGKSDAELIAEIREALSNGRITRVVDLVGPKTAALCLQAVYSPTLKPLQGEEHAEVLFAPLAMMDATEAAQAPGNVKILTVEMKQFVLDEGCAVYARELNELVGLGSVKVPELEVLEGGLAVVEEGLRRVKMGERGGRKLVVRI